MMGTTIPVGALLATPNLPTPSMSKRTKRIVLVLTVAFFGFVIADTLGVFDRRPYFEVPHGNHTHYVAKDKDPSVSVGDFPTRPPNENERITPMGQIVPK